jgi:hypothetical protein
MGFLDRMFGKRPQNTVILQPRKPEKPPERTSSTELVVQSRDALPPVLDEYDPDMLSLGWYYSENKQQL